MPLNPAPPKGGTPPEAGGDPSAHRRALHAIALFEAVKGLAALAAGIGLLGLLHHDIHHIAVALLWRFHLDPALPYPAILLHYADLLSAIDLRTLAPVALAYIGVRFLEAWGLWRGKTWAEWLGALSGALYIPLEIAHLVHRTNLINAAVLLANVVIVGFLALQLWQRK
ncbi:MULTISPECIES: DUF2127 domain-containing protein [unclassified Polaromonas]|uniref:DUF2127 domain-containing protein n=1 Tax=unclassified Polaromonas TaxID=2638319 RepID=UPI000F080527|nr:MULTISPECIES: DUF2127 domain-containing protein [unclassified Polaromonas]AYQ27089.1 DUF2127 domain-containing protein [Polaromonas sp. SP1]QGJ18066.1 DUF2127 domain-containing protein [Polaromonas sp. Pch-P]